MEAWDLQSFLGISENYLTLILLTRPLLKNKAEIEEKTEFLTIAEKDTVTKNIIQDEANLFLSESVLSKSRIK